ncbi:hypothetical protein AB1Y20_003785 [Prymnesium parvum]|uniref:Uncharacterized protein n=1 Tax=Prymnesium parvum TaxID=97485 RepID=A0AB34J7U7_PRYPA
MEAVEMVAFEGEGVWVVATAVEQVAVVVGLQVMGAFVAGPTAGRNQAQRHFRKQSHPIQRRIGCKLIPPAVRSAAVEEASTVAEIEEMAREAEVGLRAAHAGVVLRVEAVKEAAQAAEQENRENFERMAALKHAFKVLSESFNARPALPEPAFSKQMPLCRGTAVMRTARMLEGH